MAQANAGAAKAGFRTEPPSAGASYLDTMFMISSAEVQKVADATGLTLAFFSVDISMDSTPATFVDISRPGGQPEKFAVPDTPNVGPDEFDALRGVKLVPDFSFAQDADAAIGTPDALGTDDEVFISTPEAISIAQQSQKERLDWG